MPIAFDVQRQLSRVKRLPQGSDVWEGAVVAMLCAMDSSDQWDATPGAVAWLRTETRE